MIIAKPESIDENQMRQIIGARGSLSSVLGSEEQRYNLFANKLRKECIMLAKEKEEILGYIMWQEGWRTPFSANIIEFLKVHGVSGLWKYVFFTYTEWRGSVF